MSAMNLHVAMVEQLQLLPHVGTARAKRIIDAREEGPLTVERLSEVTNISQEHWGNLLMDGKITLGVTSSPVTSKSESDFSEIPDTSRQDIAAAVVSTPDAVSPTTAAGLQLQTQDDYTRFRLVIRYSVIIQYHIYRPNVQV